MKVNKKIFITIFILFALIASYFFTYIPHKLVRISPSEVAAINIFDGSTGKALVIIDKEDIEHIINNLNKITFKRGKISIGYLGYSYRTTILKKSGGVYKKFIINSNNTIRKDPFFYIDNTNSIDFEFIKELISKSS